MKQKIVIKMSMKDAKCRSKALQIAVCAQGVVSAAITGKEKNEVEVVGEDVDSVELTRRLRKKMAHAELVSVGEVDKKQEAAASCYGCTTILEPPWFNRFPQYCNYYYDEVGGRDPSSCFIL